jgi:hypothetical protein
MIGVLLAVLVTALVMLCFHRAQYDPTPPRFVSIKGRAPSGKYDWMSYEFLSPSAFEGGRMWVSVGAKKEYHVYLFDIEKQAILGELYNAAPVFFNRDQTRLLCAQRSQAETNKVRRTIMALLALARTKGQTSHVLDVQESFWVIDLQRNSATRLGSVYQSRGASSSFEPSPDFRYGFNKPTASFNLSELFICDLEKKIFRQDAVSGYPIGWWDSQRILVKATNNDFLLYDVEARKTSRLLSLQQLNAFYVGAALTNDPARATPFFMWNGRENEFYLTDGNKRWSAAESFLFKIDRPGGTLKLLDPHFKFEWSDHFDAAGKLYLYSGRKAGETNSAVYLRDLQTGRVRELVPPDPNHTNAFSIPTFHGEEVIYVHSNALWRIGLDGSNHRRLFPQTDEGP